MKTNRILTLFAALMVSVLLTAQTNQTRPDLKKTDPIKVKLEAMKYAIFANPLAVFSAEGPSDDFDKCMKKREVANRLSIYKDPSRDFCYPIDSPRPVLNPDAPSEKLDFPDKSVGGR